MVQTRLSPSPSLLLLLLLALAALSLTAAAAAAAAAEAAEAPLAEAPSLQFSNSTTTTVRMRKRRGGRRLPPWRRPPWRRPCSKADMCSFVDFFDWKHPRWLVSDEYANSNPFGSWWSRHRATWKGGKLLLSVWKKAKHARPFATGEVRTDGFSGYGCYEVRMRPVAQEGLISTFFTYTGPHNTAPGFKSAHNEIDIEFVWKKKWNKLALQFNYFTPKRGGHEKMVDLPFKPQNAFHNYAFKWTPRYIKWYVDGKEMYTAWDKKNDPLPKIWKNGPHRIYMNYWVVNRKNAAWGGFFKWKGIRVAEYQAVRFTRGENCKITNKL